MSPRARLVAAVALGCAPARIEAACNVSAVGVAFGAYDPRSATAKDGTGTVTVSCNPKENFTIALGAGGGGSFGGRRMTSGAWQLSYQLYTTSARTIVWGDGSGGTSVRGFNNSNGTTATVFGRIPALQNVGAGSYLDTVVVTVTY